MHKPIPLAQPIQPHARPRRQIIPANLVVADREAHPRQLLDDVRHGAELDGVACEIDVLPTVRARAALVLALALVAVVGDGAAVVLGGALDVQLRLNVGLEAAGGAVAGGEGDVLRGEEGDGQGEGFVDDGVGGVFAFDFGTVAYDFH